MLYCFVTFLPCSFDPIWAPEPWPLIYIILFEAFNESIGDDMATNGYQWSIKISTNCLTPFRLYLCTQSIFDWPTSSVTPMGDFGGLSHQLRPGYFCFCKLWMVNGKKIITVFNRDYWLAFIFILDILWPWISVVCTSPLCMGLSLDDAIFMDPNRVK